MISSSSAPYLLYFDTFSCCIIWTLKYSNCIICVDLPQTSSVPALAMSHLATDPPTVSAGVSLFGSSISGYD